MTNKIIIKPHHFIDIITSLGAGELDFEPHPYGHAVHTVAEKIMCDSDVLLQFELGADDICKPCTYNKDGLCVDKIDTSYRPDAPPLKRDWNLLIDKRWCQRLNIQQGDELFAREFCVRIQASAYDITDIYREIPTDRTKKRAQNLEHGIKKYLSNDENGAD